MLTARPSNEAVEQTEQRVANSAAEQLRSGNGATGSGADGATSNGKTAKNDTKGKTALGVTTQKHVRLLCAFHVFFTVVRT